MKADAALQNVTRLFLDTAPVIYYVEQNPQYAAIANFVFDQIDAGALESVTSPVTLAECLVVPIRTGMTQIENDFADLIVAGNHVTFVTTDDQIARAAAELRARYNLSIPDAMQVATATKAGCDAFLTNDLRLKRIHEIPILVLDELEL